MMLADAPVTTRRPLRLALALALASGLSGCGAYTEGWGGQAGIAYDPDGCQVWIIDDGIEGYATPRFDPETGLPVCDGRHPPGTLLGVYETESAPFPDRVSGPGTGEMAPGL